MIFNDWKSLGMAMVFLALGLYAGYSLNVDKTTNTQAAVMCSVCQSNLNTMITNFNIISRQCKVDNPYKNYNATYLNSSLVGGLNE